MVKVFHVAEMVAAEKAADAAGHSYEQMMETAGRAVAEAIIARYPVVERKVTVLVGPGNNGGDGLVAGRYLAEAGADVTFYLFKARDATEDSNLAQVEAMGLFVVTSEFDQRYRVLRTRLNITDILIDALLGTGVSRPVGGELAKMMQQVQNGLAERVDILAQQQRQTLVSIAQVDCSSAQAKSQSRPTVVAVDCPSGLNCDNGALDPLAIPADLTVTFAGPKHGHFIFPGPAACGELVVADIGISQELPEVAEVNVDLITPDMASQMLPQRATDGHKGTFGWVLIAAGSARYWGAPALAGRGAYRAGAGLVALAVPAAIRPALAVQLPEATYPVITENETLGRRAAQSLLPDIGQYKALLIGPGLHEAGDFLRTILEAAVLPPLVLDADGLNLLAKRTGWIEHLPSNTILTPHMGEMARLVGVPLAELQAQDRVTLAREHAVAWGCVLLLKGAFTVVTAPDGRCAILPFANPALATAGSGDVLSGIIVALLGQGLAPFEAAVLGGYLHGAAGQHTGLSAGLLAGEIADQIPAVWQQLEAC